MTQYNFEAYDPDEQITTTKEFQAVSLDVILKEFQYFLKGAGFEFDGNVEIVPDNSWDGEIIGGYDMMECPEYNSSFNVEVK